MLLAAVLNLGQLHAWQTSDSLLPSLVSLQAWTPFFWQQDRYGMLMPLVFGGITHPLYNQLAITWASLLGGLCAVMAVAHLFFGVSRIWPLIGLSSIALMMGAMPGGLLFDVLGPGQFFSMPMAMGLGAVWLLQHDTRGSVRWLALLLMCLAAWINCVAPVWVGLLVGAQQSYGHQKRVPLRLKRVLQDNTLVWGALLAASMAGLVAMQLAPVHDAVLTDMAAPAAIWTSCLRLTQAWVALLAASPLLLACIATLSVLAVINAFTMRDALLFRRGALQAGIACAVYMLLCASERWVAQGAYHYRFWLPAALVLMVACVGAGAGPWLHRTNAVGQRGLCIGLWCAVFVTVMVRFGGTSVAGVRKTYEDLGGAWAHEANALHCTHLAGSYWRVWPAVFAANIERYAVGNTSELLGLTDRAEATVHMWPKDVQKWRMCVPQGDMVGLGYLHGVAHVRFAIAEHGTRLDVLRPASQAAAY